MSFNSAAAVERQLIHLSDEELVDRIGTLWENVKRLEEQMRDDADIQELEEQIKEIKHERYLDNRKTYKAQLKAARYLASARGLQFKLPE